MMLQHCNSIQFRRLGDDGELFDDTYVFYLLSISLTTAENSQCMMMQPTGNSLEYAADIPVDR